MSTEFWIGTAIAVFALVIGIGVTLAMDAKTKGEFRFAVGCFLVSASIALYGIFAWQATTGDTMKTRVALSFLLFALVLTGVGEAIRWAHGRNRSFVAQQGGGDGELEQKPQGPPPKTSPDPSSNPSDNDKRGGKTVKKKSRQINQTSNAPYSPNIVTGDQGQVTINNPPPNPYGAVVTWDYNGGKRSQSPGRIGVNVGAEFGTFQTLFQSESQGDWQSLLKSSQEQIKLTPTWPTPYLFAAEANAHLGNRTLAEQQLDAVERAVSDNPGYAEHIRKVQELLK